MSASLGAPKPSADHNVAALQKTTKKVAAIVEKYKLTEEPTRCLPETVGVSMHNRGGQPPHIHVVHQTLFPAVCRDGFDPKRPRPGFAIEYKSPELLAAHLNFNSQLGDGTDL